MIRRLTALLLVGAVAGCGSVVVTTASPTLNATAGPTGAPVTGVLPVTMMPPRAGTYDYSETESRRPAPAILHYQVAVTGDTQVTRVAIGQVESISTYRVTSLGRVLLSNEARGAGGSLVESCTPVAPALLYPDHLDLGPVAHIEAHCVTGDTPPLHITETSTATVTGASRVIVDGRVLTTVVLELSIVDRDPTGATIFTDSRTDYFYPALGLPVGMVDHRSDAAGATGLQTMWLVKLPVGT